MQVYTPHPPAIPPHHHASSICKQKERGRSGSAIYVTAFEDISPSEYSINLSSLLLLCFMSSSWQVEMAIFVLFDWFDEKDGEKKEKKPWHTQ